MSSLLVPMGLSARLVKTATPVPSISGAPFNTELSLEPGIHVHWALPDALTNAKSPNPPPVPGVTDQTPQMTIFPGVPDLWLVTRFNPPVAGQKTRTWKAWVVDSRAQSVTPFETWNGAAMPPANSVHTLPGVLPAAKGFPGWGMWDGSLLPTQFGSASAFDAAVTSALYYPTGRKRFGFHDDLSGLPASGTVSYTVVGWYSSEANDPLAQSANPEQQIADWNLIYNHHEPLSTLATLLATENTIPVQSFKPQLTFSPNAAPLPVLKTAVSVTDRNARARLVSAAVGKVAGIGPIFTQTSPSSIVCHGSVMDVDLAAAPVAFSLSASQIAVHPTPKRAMTALVSPQLSGQQLDYAEMVLQDLDHLKGTTSGALDMPGAAHALTFQSVPGKPHCFAQMRVYDFEIHPVDPSNFPFELAATPDAAVSGFWPESFEVKARSSSLLATASASVITQQQLPQLQLAAPNFAPQPWVPTAADITAFQQKVAGAITATQTAATAAGNPIDPKMLRVTDRRAKAKPVRLGPSIDGAGTDAGGYWVDVTDVDQMTQLLVNTAGASVDLPDSYHIYSIPGDRWFRPWSPQLVLQNAGRTYRFGEDGRFDTVNGTLLCRTSGFTVYGIAASTGITVPASAVLANAAVLSSKANLPAETVPLLSEAVLLDTGSAPVLAAAAAPPAAQLAAMGTYFTQAIQGIWLTRVRDLSADVQNVLKTINVKGTQPSPVAITPWHADTFEALFVDAKYGLHTSPFAVDWSLDEDQVEMTQKSVPSGPTVSLTERTRVTATLVKVAQSRLITRTITNPVGHQVVRQDPPNGLELKTFDTMDMLTAPLVGFDASLFAQQLRERAGTLSVNGVAVIDVFGITRRYDAGAGGTGPSTTLLPRLPYWSRLKLTLQSATDPSSESGSQASPVCGILLPDFLDHSLQVFDGSGASIGRLDHDPANRAVVRFTAFPWYVESLPAGANALGSINPTLAQLISGIVAQPNSAPAGLDSSNTWHDTALTAMLRVIDTVRATLDPIKTTPNRNVNLLGEPILVMTAAVELETTAVTDRKQLALDPAPLTQPPAGAAVSVRIGDITRPNDGVFGIFRPGATPDQSRFAPVSVDAAQHAILNGLTEGIPYSKQLGEPVTHPFVLNQVNRISVQPDQAQNAILLTDIRGDIFATSGVLPRRSISVPKDALDAALSNMEPVFAVGPVFTAASPTGTVTPLFPPPQVQGYDVSYAPGDGNPAGDLKMPAAPPLGVLPSTRVKLDEGWVRLIKRSA